MPGYKLPKYWSLVDFYSDLYDSLQRFGISDFDLKYNTSQREMATISVGETEIAMNTYGDQAFFGEPMITTALFIRGKKPVEVKSVYSASPKDHAAEVAKRIAKMIPHPLKRLASELKQDADAIARCWK